MATHQSPWNEVNGQETLPLAVVHPKASYVESIGDGCSIKMDIGLDENNNTLILDFAEDHGKESARGASVAFDETSLRVFVSILEIALGHLERAQLRKGE